MDDHGDLPWDEAAFAALQRAVRDRAPAVAADALATAGRRPGCRGARAALCSRLVADALQPSVADAQRPSGAARAAAGSCVTGGVSRLPDVLRYVRGIEHRLERLADDVGRDRRRMAEVVPLERRYAEHLAGLGRRAVPSAVVELGWQLEELRVSVFAQPLGAKGSVSTPRIGRRLATLGRSAGT